MSNANDASQAALLAELLNELDALSAKLGAAGRAALDEVVRRGMTDVAVPWLDLGIALAESSGATATRYFTESPLLIGLLMPEARTAVLASGQELAETQANLALDWVRSAPELLASVRIEQLPRWTEIAAELASVDYVLGIEFLRQAPAVARVLEVGAVRDWVSFGTRLVTQNSLGKTDYVGTLEFFRTSPTLLGALSGSSVRQTAVRFGSALAERRPDLAITFMAEAPTLLPTTEETWPIRLLQYGVLVTERDAEAALTYIRRAPEFLSMLSRDANAWERFEAWYRGGMEVLEYSLEGGRAYFALETRQAIASMEEATNTVRLREVARSLKLFAEGLCGADVGIQPTAAHATTAGRTIALPDLINRGTREQNLRQYLVMTAHEAGHLEFGTHRVSLAALEDLAADVAARYGHARGALSTLRDLFALYPQPAVIQDLWTVLEDARIEAALRHHYPGLRADLAAQAAEAIKLHSLRHGLSARELVVDSLLLLTAAEAGSYQIPEAIADVVAQVWERCRGVVSASADAESVIRAADRAYQLMDELLARAEQTPAGAPVEAEQSAGPAAAETSGDYRPVTNLAYRGEMRPEEIGTVESPDGADDRGAMSAGTAVGSGAAQGGTLGEMVVGSRDRKAGADEISTAPDAGLGRVTQRAGGAFLYDEWDGSIRDYRAGWCRVTESTASADAGSFLDRVLVEQGPTIRLLRRYFETLRPSALRRIHGQSDGDALDFDAVVRWAAERHAGTDDSDRLYLRRDRRERDVAALFLIDLSGSTSRQLDDGRTVIDVEREALVLLCQALDAVGDQYAVYGYSGRGRMEVELTVVKAFDESLARAIDRIGSLRPQMQNRDGAAIRHAIRRLRERDAKNRLLVVLSDGKPLDDAYTDEYALEDTKAALREARAAGVHPFCITVDRDADDYLRRMYGDVQYLVIDHAAALPQRLPRLYQRLTA